VAIDETPLPYQIRMSNGHALQMLLQSYSREISVFHWKDNFDEMSLHMDDLHEFDILVFTGGVSKGKKDYMPQIWENAGFTKRIHGIQQKPGKPIWVGHNENQILFGLPGNPVSALTCAIVYVLPWIRKNIGQSIAAERIEIIAPYPTNEKLDLLLPVVYTHDHWEILKNNGSGDLIGFSNAQGIVRVPKKSQENDAQKLLGYFPAR
jgi:molybdopterin molybdotransferase